MNNNVTTKYVIKNGCWQKCDPYCWQWTKPDVTCQIFPLQTRAVFLPRLFWIAYLNIRSFESHLLLGEIAREMSSNWKIFLIKTRSLKIRTLIWPGQTAASGQTWRHVALRLYSVGACCWWRQSGPGIWQVIPTGRSTISSGCRTTRNPRTHDPKTWVDNAQEEFSNLS